MTLPDLKDNKVSLAQGFGFAITILIFVLSGWVSMNSRVSVIESKQDDIESVKKIFFEMQKDVSEMKVSIKYIELKTNETSKMLMERNESK